MDLRRTRVLVTNDDGINAPGIRILERIARQLSNDVWSSRRKPSRARPAIR